MPNYEFTCGSCGHLFTKILKIDERDDEQTCPECHSTECERSASTYSSTRFRGVHFKGQVEGGKPQQTYHLGYKTKVNKWGFNQTSG